MSRPPRIAGFAYLGPYRYFVTFCTFERRDTLCDPSVASAALAQFRRTARLTRFAVLAYCLMPDHVHLLVEGTTPGSDFRKFVKRAKQSSGQAYASHAKRRLWQEGYYERVLRREEDTIAVARYILSNPLRAGLTRTMREYPFAGSDIWPLDELIGGT